MSVQDKLGEGFGDEPKTPIFMLCEELIEKPFSHFRVETEVLFFFFFDK